MDSSINFKYITQNVLNLYDLFFKVSPFSSQNYSKHFPDPFKFDPDRFSSEGKEKNK
jgi:hypothetical protein